MTPAAISLLLPPMLGLLAMPRAPVPEAPRPPARAAGCPLRMAPYPTMTLKLGRTSPDKQSCKPSLVIEAGSSQEFDRLIDSENETPSVVICEFVSPSCRKCRVMNTKMAKLAEEFEGRAGVIRVCSSVARDVFVRERVLRMPYVTVLHRRRVLRAGQWGAGMLRVEGYEVEPVTGIGRVRGSIQKLLDLEAAEREAEREAVREAKREAARDAERKQWES